MYGADFGVKSGGFGVKLGFLGEELGLGVEPGGGGDTPLHELPLGLSTART